MSEQIEQWRALKEKHERLAEAAPSHTLRNAHMAVAQSYGRLIASQDWLIDVKRPTAKDPDSPR